MRAAVRLTDQDLLVEGPAQPGHVILNHGDPAYRARSSDDPRGLEKHEAIFLRIIAYLAFAEAVCVPARYVLTGDEMWKAFTLAEPLLRDGLLIPERRAEAESAVELAEALRLDDYARRRAEWLDEVAARVRSFRSLALGDDYRALLTDDLGASGAFRRVLRADVRRACERGLADAQEAYAALDDRTPEAFYRTVEQYARPARGAARRWAMARYYTTPTLYDNVTTRELPHSAATLLRTAGAIEREARPLDTAAPARAMYHRLAHDIPAHQVSNLARQYCEAVIDVREQIPQARSVFKDVRRRAELSGMSEELSRLMAEELARQQKLRRSGGLSYTLVTSLLGGGGGLLVGEPLLSIGLAAGSGVATYGGQQLLQDAIDRRRRPWILASDYLTQLVPHV